MTAKEYLSQARLLDARINSKVEQVARLRAKITNGVQRFSDMPHGSGVTDWTETVAKVAALEDEINAEIDRLVDLKREIAGAIAAVPNATYRDLLENRYLTGWGWARIADEMHYGRTQIWEMHGRALNYIYTKTESPNTTEHPPVL